MQMVNGAEGWKERGKSDALDRKLLCSIQPWRQQGSCTFGIPQEMHVGKCKQAGCLCDSMKSDGGAMQEL